MALRQLAFKSVDLGDDLTLILSFMPPPPTMSTGRFPSAWKITTLSATGVSTFDVTWTNKLAFSAPQSSANVREISAGTYTPIEVGETTNLTVRHDSDPPIYQFTHPVPVPGSQVVQANNNTGSPVDIALGVLADPGSDNETVNPILRFDNVGNGLSVVVKFEPILRVYAVLRSHPSELPQDATVQSSGPILQLNLLRLGPHTDIRISKDHTGRAWRYHGEDSKLPNHKSERAWR
ncbi:hypothetical protein BC628DRAFT_199136 [Trametes gibbosa]|nr:hypothetical protein BC628DRAFT_199136 [Trametes gibbosa]